LATQQIIRLLIKQREINRYQIEDLLREATTAHRAPYTDAASIAKGADPLPATRATDIDAALCGAVHSRLRALGDRIEERGKASMLPCTSRLGPAFLRPLRFLESSVALCAAPPARPPALMARG
jgi:hypothetical protein